MGTHGVLGSKLDKSKFYRKFSDFYIFARFCPNLPVFARFCPFLPEANSEKSKNMKIGHNSAQSYGREKFRKGALIVIEKLETYKNKIVTKVSDGGKFQLPAFARFCPNLPVFSKVPRQTVFFDVFLLYFSRNCDSVDTVQKWRTRMQFYSQKVFKYFIYTRSYSHFHVCPNLPVFAGFCRKMPGFFYSSLFANHQGNPYLNFLDKKTSNNLSQA